MIKVIENITKLKTQSKRNDFKNLLPQDKCKIKQVIAKQSLLTSAQIFEKSEIEQIKMDKTCKILSE